LETVNGGTSPCGRRLNPEGSPLRISQFIVPLTAAILTALPFGAAVDAALLINVDKSAQRMTVTVDGNRLYDWPVPNPDKLSTSNARIQKPFVSDQSVCA
jgi:hypothetical protein